MELEPGQEVLVNDLKELLEEAEAGEFGDMTNEKYDLPKVELRRKLLKMADNVIHGNYD